MNRHMPTGRLGLGLSLALVTALLWGTMPVVLKLLVAWIDVFTLSWARFLLSGALIAPLVVRRHGWRSVLAVRTSPFLALACVAGLAGNYLLYQTALHFISPDTAQMVIQLSPVFVVMGGLLVYREGFSRLQWLGFAALITGMALFLNPHYEELLLDLSRYTIGILLVVAAALLWAGYMLAQKQLLASMPPVAILLVVYLVASLLLAPWTRPPALANLEPYQLALLLAVTLMTVVSYLSFGAAMNHVEASRLGVVVALTPLLTVAVTARAAAVLPDLLTATRLNALSVIGAVTVVIGSMLTAIAQAKSLHGRPRPALHGPEMRAKTHAARPGQDLLPRGDGGGGLPGEAPASCMLDRKSTEEAGGENG